jgi:hypothetical protein
MLKKLPIRTRLIATMVLLGLIILAFGLLGVFGMRSLEASLEDVYSNQLVSSISVNDSKNFLSRARFAIDRAALHPEDPEVGKTLERVASFLAESGKSWSAYMAQRSAAAREIKELITASVANVDAGTELVDKAGATMNEVVASVARVTSIMSEIMSASQEQSEGIEQINRAVLQMDQVTQQNAALVEEAAAASSSLQDQARSLMEAVAVFQLEHHQAPRRGAMLLAA